MIDRADIVAAVDGLSVDVEGGPVTITAYPSQPATPVAYDAWPYWQRTHRVTGCAVEREWWLVVVLPAAVAEGWALAGDAVDAAVSQALYDKGIGWADSEPVQLMLAESSPVPTVRFTFSA